MLTVNIICIGKLKEKYLTDACNEYQKRLKLFCKFNIIELAEVRISDNPSDAQITQTLESEAALICAKLLPQSYKIAMCIEGKMLSSEQLAKSFEDIALRGHSTVDIIIGSSHGLSDSIKNSVNFKLSMSPMTFPHQLARVMLCEQIYRAFQINNNGKYHK